jgi:hypothetical protein
MTKLQPTQFMDFAFSIQDRRLLRLESFRDWDKAEPRGPILSGRPKVNPRADIHRVNGSMSVAGANAKCDVQTGAAVIGAKADAP